ncbi:response regulator [Bradyrhizobium sp. 5.13L]
MQINRTNGSRTIVLAEQDVLVRMSLADYLRGCGYKVLEARSADEAIRLLEDGSIPAHVVISSVELAGDGFGIAKWLRDHRPDLELRLTGSTKRAVDVAASLCEGGPLPAPYNPQILHRRILRLMGGRRSRPQEGHRTMAKA